MSYFNNALSFINTNYSHSTYFYILSTRKVLNYIRIRAMFTKNNVNVNKINNCKAKVKYSPLSGHKTSIKGVLIYDI